jgi:hypothetical protein
MSVYPKMYRVWLTKHVSDFCGNNVQLYYLSHGAHLPKCKYCGTHDKYTEHICRCKDPGQERMFQISVSELKVWLTTTLGELTITSTIEAFLLSRGEKTMVDCLHGNSNDLHYVAECSDCLGWDSFVEGRITTHWLEVVAPLL